MKYIPLLILALSLNAYATKPKEEPPVIHVEQDQRQDQNQSQTQSIGDIDNSNWLSNKLDQFNEQANRQNLQNINQNCLPEPGYQELDGAGYSVTTFGGTLGHENQMHSTALYGALWRSCCAIYFKRGKGGIQNKSQEFRAPTV